MTQTQTRSRTFEWADPRAHAKTLAGASGLARVSGIS
jgi:hypothetical protein